MYNNTGFRRESYGNRKQILWAPEHRVGVSIVVSQSAGVKQDDGRTIVKAGTPLAGNLNERTTPFTKGTAADVVGILEHDVDVTVSDNNGSLVIFGFVNTNRVDDDVKELLTDDINKALPLVTILAM